MIKFKSAYIQSFGGLEEYALDFIEDKGVYFALNEFGKSTLSSFLLAVLYGLAKNSRDVRSSDRKRYRPLQHDKQMGGSLRLEKNGRNYEIQALFGSVPKKDQLKIFDIDAGREITAELSRDDHLLSPGEYFLGIDQATFERSVFVAQTKTSLADCKDNKDVFQSLFNLQNTGDENISISKIDEYLKKRSSKLKGRSKDAEINRLEREIATKEQLLAELIAAEAEEDRRQKSLSEIEQTINQQTRLVDDLHRQEVGLEYAKLSHNLRSERRKLALLEEQERELLAQRQLAEKENWREGLSRLEQQLNNIKNLVISRNEREGQVSEVLEAFQHSQRSWVQVKEAVAAKQPQNEQRELEQSRRELAELAITIAEVEKKQQSKKRLQQERLQRQLQEVQAKQASIRERLLKYHTRQRLNLILISLSLFLGISSVAAHYLDFLSQFKEQLSWVTIASGVFFFILLILLIAGFFNQQRLQADLQRISAQSLNLNTEQSDTSADQLTSYLQRQMQLQKKISRLSEVINSRVAENERHLTAAASKLQSEQDHLANLRTKLLQQEQELEKTKESLSREYSLPPDITVERIIQILEQRQEELNHKISKLQSSDSLISRALDELNLPAVRRTVAAYEQQLTELEAQWGMDNIGIFHAISVEDLEAKSNELKIQLQARRTELTDLRLQFAQEKGRLIDSINIQGNAQDVKEEIAILQEELLQAEKLYEATQIAGLLMNEAFQAMRRDFAPELQQRAQEYFRQLTAGKYTDFLSDHDLNIQVGNKNYMDAAYLSVGAFDQAYLALRLALSELLSEQICLPLIIDDGFTQYDDERLQLAFDLLSDISADSKRQIIYFTSTKHTVTAAERSSFKIKYL